MRFIIMPKKLASINGCSGDCSIACGGNCAARCGSLGTCFCPFK